MPSFINNRVAYIVDDQRIWRNVLSKWLKRAGYEVLTANNRESAERLFKDSEIIPELIILDIGLNLGEIDNRDGLHLCDLRGQYKHLKNSKLAFLSSVQEAPQFVKVRDIKLISKNNKEGMPINEREFIKEIEKL